MYPDQEYDKTGVFSGSAVVDNDTMYFFYTGNVNHPGETPDHEQFQAIAISTDGVNVTKYEGNPVIKAKEHQPNIRDPKVWRYGDTFYMVLGNSINNDTFGRALLYSSKDMISWKQESVLDESDGSLGFMWECPDFFELDGKFVLLFSPQGIKPQGDKYKNLYQTGYLVGRFDYVSKMFTVLTDFQELDHGHDFYATQSILDPKGRRIVIAWFDMWENVYPERNHGWTGQMTIPRTLSLTSDNRLIQKPIKEISAVRGTKLHSGKALSGTSVKLEDNTAEIIIVAASGQNVEVLLESGNQTVSISYDYIKGKVTLVRDGEDGLRRTKWRPNGKLRWQIFIDASSIELFCGGGEVTFSSRFFPKSEEVNVKLGAHTQVENFTVFGMKRTVEVPENCYT